MICRETIISRYHLLAVDRVFSLQWMLDHVVISKLVGYCFIINKVDTPSGQLLIVLHLSDQCLWEILLRHCQNTSNFHSLSEITNLSKNIVFLAAHWFFVSQLLNQVFSPCVVTLFPGCFESQLTTEIPWYAHTVYESCPPYDVCAILHPFKFCPFDLLCVWNIPTNVDIYFLYDIVRNAVNTHW